MALEFAAEKFAKKHLSATKKSEKGKAKEKEQEARDKETEHEAIIMRLFELFCRSKGNLTGFQKLVPHVFDRYLTFESERRAMLLEKVRT